MRSAWVLVVGLSLLVPFELASSAPDPDGDEENLPPGAIELRTEGSRESSSVSTLRVDPDGRASLVVAPLGGGAERRAETELAPEEVRALRDLAARLDSLDATVHRYDDPDDVAHDAPLVRLRIGRDDGCLTIQWTILMRMPEDLRTRVRDLYFSILEVERRLERMLPP